MYKHCKHCGKLFETRHPKKIYCSVKCRRRYYYVQELLALVEEARKAEQERETRQAKQRENIKSVPPSAVPSPSPAPAPTNPKGQIAKLWDPRDPECIRAMEFIRTIKPIDFSGFNEELDEKENGECNASRALQNSVRIAVGSLKRITESVSVGNNAGGVITGGNANGNVLKFCGKGIFGKK